MQTIQMRSRYTYAIKKTGPFANRKWLNPFNTRQVGYSGDHNNSKKYFPTKILDFPKINFSVERKRGNLTTEVFFTSTFTVKNVFLFSPAKTGLVVCAYQINLNYSFSLNATAFV
jgi:hypothetical protein